MLNKIRAVSQEKLVLAFAGVGSAFAKKNAQTSLSISSGPMIVGNMGSETRMDFSVLGDAVNMAARFEGLNKRWGTTILIAEETYNQLSDKSLATGPVVTPLRGNDSDITVYVVETGQPHTAPVPFPDSSDEGVLVWN